MKHVLTGFAAALAAFVSLGAASPAAAQYQAPPYGAALPPFEVMTIIRSMGFDPISRPVLRGPVYVVQALDDEGISVRVLVDAQRGNVVRVTESRPDIRLCRFAARARIRASAISTRNRAARCGLSSLRRKPSAASRKCAIAARPKVATRTPLPRPAPPQSRAARHHPLWQAQQPLSRTRKRLPANRSRPL